MTMLSPWLVGMVETRRSMDFFPIFTWMRPSCGSRFSAMLMEPVMILIRLMMALCNFLGGLVISCSTPSMRNRTRNRFSSGSRWISLARILWASSRSIETILMIGASPVSACALAHDRAIAKLDLIPRPAPVPGRSQPPPRCRSSLTRAVLICAGVAQTKSMSRFSRCPMASNVSKSSGLLVAIIRPESVTATGMTLYRRAVWLGISFDDLLRDGDLPEVHKIHAGRRCQRPAHILVTDRSLVDERLDNALLRRRLLPGALELGVGDEAGIDQDFRYVIVICDHGRINGWGNAKKVRGGKGTVNARAREKLFAPQPVELRSLEWLSEQAPSTVSQVLVGHRSLAGAADQLGVLRQHAARCNAASAFSI